MFERIKQILEFGSKKGFYFPSAYDAVNKLPSSSLLFSHISFMVSIGAIVYLCYQEIDKGVYAAMIFSGMNMVFYLMRRIGKFKIDADDKSIELESETDNTINPNKDK